MKIVDLASPLLICLTIKLMIWSGVAVAAEQAAPVTNALSKPMASTSPPVISTGMPANVATPHPAIPAGFVVVQSTYLEQVSATAKSAIDAAKDKEEWMVRIVQLVGIMVTAIAALATFLGYKTYKDLKEHVAGIRKTEEEVKLSSNAMKEVVRQAKKEAKRFQSKLVGMERLFIGIHSFRLVIGELDSGRSEQQVNDARGELAEAKELYELSREHGNKRIQSFMAANLSIVYMRAQQWEDARKYGLESIECNPKNWSDRQYNLACICARKYEAHQLPSDKAQAVESIRKYLERRSPVELAEIDEALGDDDLVAIKPELEEIKQALVAVRTQA